MPPTPKIRLTYGSDPNQFGELRLPAATKGKLTSVVNIHGGFWLAEYDLTDSERLCDALVGLGIAVWNMEYRRVGQKGGGWPGTFEDVRAAYRYIVQNADKYNLDPDRMLVMGHSAGGQLALCLAAHEPAIKRAISLAGVVDMVEADQLHLGEDAIKRFLGGSPKEVPEHYHEADPNQRPVKATQWLIHGSKDDTVPSYLSRQYTMKKKSQGEDVHYLEIATADHSQLIDPHSAAWPKVEATVLNFLK